MSQKPSIPQGTRDFGPEVMLRRERIFDTLRRCFRKRGFLPLETPSMEKLSVLTGKYGEEGDQLIFKILNNGDFLKDAKDLHDSQKLAFQISEKALRYDLTVPFARFVVMHQNELTFPFKRYQIQPVWRGDRPGKGRYREFFQCDADVVGSDSLLYEAEFINLFDEALTELGLPGFSILINNRKILSGYAELAGTPEKTTDICTAIDKLDKIGQEGVVKELTERGISAENAAMLLELIAFSPDDAALSQDQINQARLAYLKTRFAPGSAGYQGVEEMEEIFALSQHFPSYKGTLTFDLSLARGLNYYTGAIFEVKAQGVAIGSICGGGRYADLTGVFGLKGLSGVGISFGADRIYDVMEALGLFGDLSTAPVQVMIVNFGPDTLTPSLLMLNQLREAGVSSELYPEPGKLKKQFAYADKKTIPYTLIIGEEEVQKGQYQLRNMQSGAQELLAPAEIIARLKG